MRSKREGSVVFDQPKQGGVGKFSTQGREGGTFREWSVGVGKVGGWRLWVSGLRALVYTGKLLRYCHYPCTGMILININIDIDIILYHLLFPRTQ